MAAGGGGDLSVMRVLRVDSRVSGRCRPVGIDGNTIYVQPAFKKAVQLWSLNTLYPSSWTDVFSLPVEELFYSIPCCSYHSAQLFVLIVAVFRGEEYPRISIFEIDRHTKATKEYRLDESAGAEFESVSLENAHLGCGPEYLHIYDRSMVMGSIPYWKIVLLENSFVVERKDIPDASEEKCVRFPIAISPESGVFARLRSDHSLAVSDGQSPNWTVYHQAPEDTVDLAELATRGLHETYGRAGHRMGAVESALTIYSDGPVTVAKVTRDKTHFYYRILLDHDLQEFRCVPQGRARFSGGLDQMFYTIVGERTFVILGIKAIGVAALQPATLAESALWSLQRSATKIDTTGSRYGGIKDEQVRAMCNYTHNRNIT